jgi:hypothetical protein
MSRSAPILTSFNAGELSPTLDGRVDLAKYANGCKVIENFLPIVQGPAVRRGGTKYVAATKGNAKTWLIKFEFSATQAYVLEFGNLYVRFYKTDHTQLLVLGVPYEIVSPYALADLTNADGTCALKVEQSGDVIYIANQYRTYAPRKLTRFAETTWTFSTYQPNQGPLLEQNSSSTTIQSSAQSGVVTLTASGSIFVAGDVNRLVRLDSQNLSVKPWETNKAYAINDLVRSNGKTYKALTAATSGTSTPIHEKGTAYDGQAGVQWQYEHAGYGMARITAFTDVQHVTATVITDEANGLNKFPLDVTTGTTTRWQLGAWASSVEFPASVCFWRNRLWWAGRQRLWGSVPDDFENMAGDFFGSTETDSAIWAQLQAQDVNDILWLAGADKLIVGTGGGEFVGGEITTTDPVGPGNFKLERQSKKRVRATPPIAVGSSLLYVQRAGRKLLAFNYSFEQDRYVATDLAVLAERITRGSIIDMAYQGEPYSILWVVLQSGKLLAFTYDKDQDVLGWVRVPIGGNGFVESVAVTPTSDGTREEVWICVKRTINGATVRYVEYLTRPWEGPDEDGEEGDDQEDAYYVDAGITYDGVSTSTITGLGHLEGQTVQVLGDGAVQPDKTVSGGAITLTLAASVVQVGLQFTSRLVTMRIESGSQTGTSQGKTKRIDSMKIRFLDSLGGKAGMYGGTLDTLAARSPSTPMGQAEPIFSGDKNVDYAGDYDSDCMVEVRQEQPLPMTIVAIMPLLKTYDP